MFSTVQVPKWSPYKFSFPSAQPIAIVKQIIEALDEQQSRTILLPFYTNLGPCLSLFPNYLKDFVVWVSDGMKIPAFSRSYSSKLGQANYVMSDFTKISGRRVDESEALDSTNKME